MPSRTYRIQALGFFLGSFWTIQKGVPYFETQPFVGCYFYGRFFQRGSWGAGFRQGSERRESKGDSNLELNTGANETGTALEARSGNVKVMMQLWDLCQKKLNLSRSCSMHLVQSGETSFLVFCIMYGRLTDPKGKTSESHGKDPLLGDPVFQVLDRF